MQDFSDYVLHIDNTVATIAKDAKVTYNSIDLGGHVVVTDYTAYMDGDGSGSESRTAYLGSGKRRLDIGFNLFHTGKHTESLIRTKGALLGESRKIFRGNMKFERGSKRSTGSESEYVLLLDKRVHSDAIPALLCDEDDVQGEHAASAGQVNDNQLYYLMSRGFSKKEAMKLIIHGNFAEFMDSLPSEAYRNYIDEELNRRLVYGDD
jgi:Fe-S cluster assembly protein SufD